ncbi:MULTISPECIES: hypothetical protein [Legionella]|uniref:Uncharacterized protein n=1 Tax=Legionella steelei TaxID=947033 RepID=A0A0W0ZPB8_9GAMM|nr:MULTISPECIES: hypothetical protein [Legionella]KTD70761.1 hypothetical protein Lste_0539 [Legionella steelei]MBN9227808.1 hypothetical protein [Legionella steelei]OJW05764.1 MAG: hypothetical protein BGO44_02170 [Legionella sp. 39-23]
MRIIKENPTLILTHIDFTFPDGHTEKISPLKYAIKILDTAVLDACLYSGVISEGLATDGSYGTAMKGLFELQMKYLQSFHTQAQTRLAQIIQKAEAQQMRQDNREFNF